MVIGARDLDLNALNTLTFGKKIGAFRLMLRMRTATQQRSKISHVSPNSLINNQERVSIIAVMGANLAKSLISGADRKGFKCAAVARLSY